LNEFQSVVDVLTTLVFGEGDVQVLLLDHGFEQILLVQEQENGTTLEDAVVADFVEQFQRLVHAVLRGVFEQDLVVTSEVIDEQDASGGRKTKRMSRREGEEEN
jgi:hypothetical protein